VYLLGPRRARIGKEAKREVDPAGDMTDPHGKGEEGNVRRK
jgi:hypothetical protein